MMPISSQGSMHMCMANLLRAWLCIQYFPSFLQFFFFNSLLFLSLSYSHLFVFDAATNLFFFFKTTYWKRYAEVNGLILHLCIDFKYCMRKLTRYPRINYMEWTNAIQNRCYMCIQWTRVLYSVVITWHSIQPISQFNSPCNEFTSVWSMFVYTIRSGTVYVGQCLYTL